MKKPAAILACAAIICTLVSCSDKGESSSELTDATAETTAETTTEDIADAAETTSPAVTTSAPETTAVPETTAPDTDETTAPVPAEPIFTGKWECIGIEIEGEHFDGEYMGVPLYAMLCFEIFDDGSAHAISPIAGSSTDVSWEKNGEDLITIGNDGGILPAHIDGDTLVMESDDDGMIYYFGLVDEFSEFDYDEWFENYDYQAYLDSET